MAKISNKVASNHLIYLLPSSVTRIALNIGARTALMTVSNGWVFQSTIISCGIYAYI